jgi:hypothetical protein
MPLNEENFMDDLERLQYIFDIQGYLIIPNVLTSDEIAELNGLIDAQNLPKPEKLGRFGGAAGGARKSGSGFLSYGKPFCDLLDHDRIMPILRMMLGDYFRLDRIYGMHMDDGMTGLRMHGGNTPFSPGEYYHVRDGKIVNGFTVVSWNLTDTGPDYGGFCCIPGSHKGNFRLPKQIREAHDEDPFVIMPEAPAGSVIMFSEALTHGTATWHGKHQRRSLLYKFLSLYLTRSWKRLELRSRYGKKKSIDYGRNGLRGWTYVACAA